MAKPKSSNWFICTISAGGLHNWNLCKEVSLWGIPSNGRNLNMNQIEPGDGLLFYWATQGLIAHGIATSPMKRPLSKDEAPWAGGVFRFGIVIPFELKAEAKNALPIKFEAGVAVGTNVKVTSLRRGFAKIEPSDGQFLLANLKKCLLVKTSQAKAD